MSLEQQKNIIEIGMGILPHTLVLVHARANFVTGTCSNIAVLARSCPYAIFARQLRRVGRDQADRHAGHEHAERQNDRNG